MGLFDPYHKWLGIPPEQQPPNHYRLLALEPFESDRDVIDIAAEQRILYLERQLKGPHGPAAKQLLGAVESARICLLNREQKQAYDAQLASLTPNKVTKPNAAAHQPQTDGFDPYHTWLGIPPHAQPPDRYRLLGLEPSESDPDAIAAASEQRMAYLQQCGTGPHSIASQKLMNEVSAARIWLLDRSVKPATDRKASTKAKQDGASPQSDISAAGLRDGDHAAFSVASSGWALNDRGTAAMDERPLGCLTPSRRSLWKKPRFDATIRVFQRRPIPRAVVQKGAFSTGSVGVGC